MAIRRKRKTKKVGGIGPIIAGLLPAILGTAMVGTFANIFRHNEKKMKRRGLGRKR
jgi:hypothetical protein